MGIPACPVRLRPEQHLPRPRAARSLGTFTDEPGQGGAPRDLLTATAISSAPSRPPSGPVWVSPLWPARPPRL